MCCLAFHTRIGSRTEGPVSESEYLAIYTGLGKLQRENSYKPAEWRISRDPSPGGASGRLGARDAALCGTRKDLLHDMDVSAMTARE
jgi:hypothetical protein